MGGGGGLLTPPVPTVRLWGPGDFAIMYHDCSNNSILMREVL